MASPRVNLHDDYEASFDEAAEFFREVNRDQDTEILQVLVPVPRALLLDRSYDLPDEIMPEIREALQITLKNYYERLHATTPTAPSGE